MNDLSAIWHSSLRGQGMLPRSIAVSRNRPPENNLGVNVLAVNKKDEISWIEKNITRKQGCIYWLSLNSGAAPVTLDGAETGAA
ncbi:hypothetical protein [Achromobacter sp. DMS1]|uniref:hypothetical protein n=1 Tax=Achromobacter sp. DMS1 TaxID=1688405 RepID=UPI00128EB8ED|nr:hypothetical protein [Achromobacter sp. DMS1]